MDSLVHSSDLRVVMQPGTRWGDHYTIGRPLGRGAIGTVYAATHTVVQRVVALKVFDAFVPAQQAEHRLLRDAQLASGIDHERIARVYEIGTYDGIAYAAMEYVDGRTLRGWDDRAQGAVAAGRRHRDPDPRSSGSSSTGCSTSISRSGSLTEPARSAHSANA
jgi:serine/threonine-protein kinase